ncbi:helix-turn-helix transcriptional regulator [Polaribacter sp.]|uniref:helix-turn-helix transcriptional regulator n=1 Tax=Polaribacter sp. TaxID=1920175 RepID=UPI003F6C34EE
MKNRIKIERAICNLTQAELARKVGVSRQTIHLIEKGKAIPSTVLALKISKIFQKPVNVFFELDEKE